MASKTLTRLQARVVDHAVCLSAYKSTAAFEDKQLSTDTFRAIRVYRKNESDFTFGEDYAEYFDGLSWREAKLVFEGSIEDDLPWIDEGIRIAC